MEPPSADPFSFDSQSPSQNPQEEAKQGNADAMYDAFNGTNQAQEEIAVDMTQGKEEPQKNDEEEEFKFANTNVPKKVVQVQEPMAYEYV
jgi:hypothetical protein